MAFFTQIAFVCFVPEITSRSPLATDMTAPTLLLLAAGMGSRYGGLKQLDPMGPNGETLLDYAIHDARHAGFAKAVFVIRRSMEAAFTEQILRRYQDHIATDVAFQELDDLPAGFAAPPGRERPWGTGHAVLAARHVIQEPFAVINADDYYGPSAYMLLAQALAAFSPAEPALACIAYPLRLTLSQHGTVNRGICTVRDDQLLSVEEVVRIGEREGALFGQGAHGQRQLTGDESVSMNAWAMTPALFDPMRRAFHAFLDALRDPLNEEFFLPAFLNEWIAQPEQACHITLAQDRWCGVTHPSDRPAVQAHLLAAHREGRYPPTLFPCP